MERIPKGEIMRFEIDDAIRHCEKVAERCEWPGCAADHRQLARWLQELKWRRQYPAEKEVRKATRIENKWYCMCGSAVGRFWKYCQHCGALIDWSERDEGKGERRPSGEGDQCGPGNDQ